MTHALERSHSGTVIIETPGPLEFGGHLGRHEVGFRIYGDPELPLVVALGGISAGRHIMASTEDHRRGWWDELAGAGRAIDTQSHAVLGIDWLGGSGASTGPGRTHDRADHPGAGAAAGRFPSIGTLDQGRAVVAVLDHLRIEKAHAIVGASYGGMVALSSAVNLHERFGRAVVISAAHRSHPMATALRSLQRGVVRLGIETGRVAESLGLARGIAMTTYRTAEEFRHRFDAEARWSPAGPRFPVEEYLDHGGRRFAATFSAESFLCLSESIDLHWMDPASARLPLTLVAVSSDTLVPEWQMAELRDSLTSAPRWHVVDSIYGHDAFLKERDAMSLIIAEALT